MAEIGKVDLACIGFMVVVILTASGYWAVLTGWVQVGSDLVWMGWVWWVVFGLVVVSIIIMAVTSRRRNR